ncbi:MAG: right-handed parallel beta-helix repeat-containing protein [Thermoplasmatota archaeon]
MGKTLSSVLTAFILLSGGLLFIENPAAGLIPDTDETVETAPFSVNVITILNDTDLAEQALLNGWGGDGSESNPYRIRQLAIDAGGGDYGIFVNGTSSFLTIRNITITNTRQDFSSPGKAVWLNDVENVTLHDIRASNHHYGAFINNSRDIDIDLSVFNYSKTAGIHISNSHRIKIYQTGLTYNLHGMMILTCTSIEILSCIIGLNDIGADLESSSDIDLMGTSFNQNIVGTRMTSCREYLLDDDSFEKNTAHGLYMVQTTEGQVGSCSFTENRIGAEYLMSDVNRITDNYYVKNSRTGLIMNSSRYCTLEDNIFSLNNKGGLLLYRSYYLDLYSNSFEKDGIDIDMANLFETVNIPSSNTINDKPIYMYNDGDQYNSGVPEDAGQVIIAGVYRLNLENLMLSDVYKSIISLFSNQILVKNATITDCDYGIFMTSSSGTEVSESTFNKCGFGVYANDPYQLSTGFILVRNNIFRRIGDISVYIEELDSCGIEGNRFEYGIETGILMNRSGGFAVDSNTFHYVANGMILNDSYEGLIEGNTFFRGGYGLELTAQCFDNTITDNLFLENDFNAVLIGGLCGTDNYAMENAFIDNGVSTTSPQVYDPVGIRWSIEKKGNYWSNHTSPDNDEDGIVDLPLYIDGGHGIDEYPLSSNPVGIISQPLDPNAAGGKTWITLSWQTPAFSRGEPVLRYIIYKGTDREDLSEFKTVGSDHLSCICENLDGDTEHFFTIRAENIYGRSAHSKMVDAWTDFTPPTIEIIQPNHGSHLNSGDVTVRWDISDPISGVSTSELYRNDVFVANVTGYGYHDFTDLADGTYVVRIDTRDNVGNENQSAVEFTVDTGFPNVEITGDPVLISRDPNIVVNWVGTDEIGIFRYEYRLNNGTWNDIGMNTERYFEDMVDGYYWFDVRAVDEAGNHAVDSLEIFVDTTGSKLKITSPLIGTYLDDSDITIQWTAEDDVTRIDHFMITVDGRTPARINGLDRQYTVYHLTDGNHELSLVAEDLAGNRASTYTNFIVDTMRPEIMVHSPKDVDNHVNSIIKVTFSEEMRTETVMITASDLNGFTKKISDGYIFEYEGKLRYNWSYTVRVSGEDMAGNPMISFEWSFRTIDQAWIKGRVLDEFNDPVIGATILINGESQASTSNLGNFNISLRSGRYSIVILKQGYGNWSGNAVLIPGENHDLGIITLESVRSNGDGNGTRETDGEGGGLPLWTIFAILVFILLIAAAALFVYFNVVRREKPVEKIDESPWDRAERMRRLAEYHQIDIVEIDKIYRNAIFNKGLGKINHATDEIKEYNHTLADTLQEFGINPEVTVEDIEKAFDSAKEREFEMLMDESLDIPEVDEFNLVAQATPPDVQAPESSADISETEASGGGIPESEAPV